MFFWVLFYFLFMLLTRRLCCAHAWLYLWMDKRTSGMEIRTLWVIMQIRGCPFVPVASEQACPTLWIARRKELTHFRLLRKIKQQPISVECAIPKLHNNYKVNSIKRQMMGKLFVIHSHKGVRDSGNQKYSYWDSGNAEKKTKWTLFLWKAPIPIV